MTHASKMRRGGILGGLAVAFLLISACLVLAGVYFVHNVKVRESRSGHDVQVETPIGSVHVQHGVEGRREPVGLPVYPGATPLEGKEHASVDLSELFGDNDLHIVAGKWKTDDEIGKVQKFYEDRLPGMSVNRHKGQVEMHSIDGHEKRVVVLRDRRGFTEISLASVGEPKAN